MAKHVIKKLDSHGFTTTTEPVSLGNNLVYTIERNMSDPVGHINIISYNDYPQGEILGNIYPGDNRFFPMNHRVKETIRDLLSENKLRELYKLVDNFDSRTDVSMFDIPSFDDKPDDNDLDNDYEAYKKFYGPDGMASPADVLQWQKDTEKETNDMFDRLQTGKINSDNALGNMLSDERLKNKECC